MHSWSLSTVALLALRALSVAAAEAPVVEEATTEQVTTPNLKVDISTSFPQAEIFGVKLVNGHPTQAVLSIANQEPEPITIEVVGGSLFNVQTAQPVTNLTVTRYGLLVPAGEKESLTYSFSTELHPQDLRLSLQAIISDHKKRIFTVLAYNETVSVVEAPVSIFDPQIIFLYLILAAGFGGVCYFIYNTWITTLFPQKRRTGKAPKGPRTGKKPEVAEPTSPGVESPVLVTGSKYDASWIPQQHLQRPEAKRVRSGTPKTKPKA